MADELDKLAWPYRYGLVTTIFAAVLLAVLVGLSFYHVNTTRALRADISRLSAIDTVAYNATIRSLDRSLKEYQARYDSLDMARPAFVPTPTQNMTDVELQALLIRRLRGER